MGRPDGDSEDFSGIDPQKLWDLINSIKNRTGGDGNGAAQPLVKNWMSQATRMGLDTSQLSAINKHLSWSQDQLPMLRRRHSLAVDGAKAGADFGGSTGMVTAGAGSLGNYKTQAQAKKAAEDDAKAYDDGKISLQDYYKKLQANQFDPDYCKAAANALGDAKLHVLQQEAFTADPEDPQAGMTILANFVATAMRNGTTLKDDQGDEDMQLLAGLVPHASFPKDVLLNLGKQCLTPGGSMYGQYVWPALTDDPAAATQFLHDHMDMLPQYMASDSDHHGGLPANQADLFAQVVKAGTLGGPGADQNMAADNTTNLVKFYSTHPATHTHGPIQQVFAQDIQAYWNDLVPSVTDPAPVNDYGPGHVSASADEWRAFIDESMRDPHATAFLLSYSSQQSANLLYSDPNNLVIQQSSGLIDGFFGHEATRVYQDMGANKSAAGKKWQGSVTTWLNTGILNAVNIAFDPSSIAIPLTKAVITETSKYFADKYVPAGEQGGTIPKSTQWQDEWIKSAAAAHHTNPNLGNPQQYADLYSNGKPFLAPGGLLVDGASVGQEQAYNAWLKDKELTTAIAPVFNSTDRSRIDGTLGDG